MNGAGSGGPDGVCSLPDCARRYSLTACALVAATVSAATGFAAPPKVTALFPAGIQRGATTAVTATGEFPVWPVQVWVDRPGLTIEVGAEKGKLAVTAAADAEPGIYWLRLYDASGASALRAFAVGLFAEREETEPNNRPQEGTPTELPTLINGRLNPRGDVDGFTVTLRAGETLVASLDAHAELGSPMDAVLQVCELKETASRSLEAFVLMQQHDAVELDPRLAFTAPHDGKYLVRTFAFPSQPDTQIAYAGGDAYVYRLTLTTAGFVDYVLPLAVPRGQPAELAWFGWNLPDRKVALPAPAAPGRPYRLAWRDDVPGSIRLRETELPIVAASAGGASEPVKAPVPAVVCGQLTDDGSPATIEFAASKGEPLLLGVESRSLGLPLDAHLQVLNDKGERLVEQDDAGQRRDPELLFNPPADGIYRAQLKDLAGRGGKRFAYLLSIAPTKGDFRLTLAADTFTVEAGKSVEVPVTVARQFNIAAELSIGIEGLPAGVTSAAVISEKTGDTAGAVKLTINAAADAAPFSGPIRIVGQCVEPKLRRTAEFPMPGLVESSDLVWLTVVKNP